MSRGGWVTARANCSAEDCLNAIIKQVKADVAEFNRLPAHKRGGAFAFRTAFNDGELVVRRVALTEDYRGTHDTPVGDGTDVVVVRRADDAISACRAGKLHVSIIPQWNADRQECDYLLDEQPCQLWQIGERILGGFLFDSES